MGSFRDDYGQISPEKREVSSRSREFRVELDTSVSNVMMHRVNTLNQAVFNMQNAPENQPTRTANIPIPGKFDLKNLSYHGQMVENQRAYENPLFTTDSAHDKGAGKVGSTPSIISSSPVTSVSQPSPVDELRARVDALALTSSQLGSEHILPQDVIESINMEV